MAAIAGSANPPGRVSLARRLARLDDGVLMRAVFFTMLAAVAVILVLDYREMAEAKLFSPERPMTQPILPPASGNPGASPDGAPLRPGEQPPVTTDPELLRQAMRIELGRQGVLRLEGTITQGTSERFAAEVARIGEYVRRIELDSPGGSAIDALQMSRLIREQGFATHVARGELCASSCPLLLAGGETRTAEEGAVIGVHQVYPVSEDGLSPRQAAAGTQAMTAQVTRLLGEMGVDPALWLHALDTPPERLYYLSIEEMERYRLTGRTEG
ncbi:MAG: hypothetical protein VYD64_06225 [Pseudomonadota bacterium]|nr:hypothetical protein [Pseudomonadota bacterium]